ncbi:MAG TPA: AbrB/MazE/SpoVT family DNA-binding domain-containing protein [Verrucomicrobiales bacterium]|nr:AbrB/MazE/SpoVT family DNA-binding domain-containing protein [Verrucomicrobiales bacterium]
MKYYLFMKITSKGQVTVPLLVRNEFGLKPGTHVDFVTEATGIAQGMTTTAKIMKLTRGEK